MIERFRSTEIREVWGLFRALGFSVLGLRVQGSANKKILLRALKIVSSRYIVAAHASFRVCMFAALGTLALAIGLCGMHASKGLS